MIKIAAASAMANPITKKNTGACINIGMHQSQYSQEMLEDNLPRCGAILTMSSMEDTNQWAI